MTDKMYATICLCLVSLVACGTEHTLSGNNGYYAIQDKFMSLATIIEDLLLEEGQPVDELSVNGTNFHDYLCRRRKKRVAKVIGSAVLIGIRAINKLLDEARHVKTIDGSRIYVKTGGYNQAKTDFERVNPKQVFVDKTGGHRMGVVGDRVIHVHRNTMLQHPVLSIGRSSTLNNKRDIILYDD